MTTKEKFIDMLVNNGMFPEQAKEVMKIAIPEIDKVVPEYRITWDRPWTEYPVSMYAVVFQDVKKHAVTWIDKNLPKAWYRPMFAESGGAS